MKKFWVYVILAIPWIALVDFLFGFRDWQSWAAAWGIFVIYIFMAVLFGYLIYVKLWSLNRILIILMILAVLMELGGGNTYFPFALGFARDHLILGSLIFLVWFVSTLGVYMIEIFIPLIAISSWEKMTSHANN